MKRAGTKPVSEVHRCKNCNRKLAPDYQYTHELRGNETIYRYTGTILGYGYRGDRTFCTLECGYRFGLRCVSAGGELERFDPSRAPKPAPRK